MANGVYPGIKFSCHFAIWLGKIVKHVEAQNILSCGESIQDIACNANPSAAKGKCTVAGLCRTDYMLNYQVLKGHLFI